MLDLYRLAEWLVASWKVAYPTRRLPTSHGILDRALHALLTSETPLPDWVREDLTFADTRVGLRCRELPAILDCAQESYLTSEPNYTYLTTAIRIDTPTGERLLEDLGLDKEQAQVWGRFLGQEIDRLTTENSEPCDDAA